MAATVKMGVDVSGFKSGMQQAQQSAKMLQAQMKANEAQFKATGDKEKYVAEQSKLLKAQLDAQKTAAKNAEQAMKAMRDAGISETSAEYQRLATQLANAQAAIYNTSAAMNTLAASESNASGGAQNLGNNLSSINKNVSMENVTGALNKISSGLESIGKKAIEAGKAIWDAMLDSAAYADDVNTMADMLGLTTQEVQQMQYVANRFEAPVETVAKTWKKLRMNMTSDSAEIAEGFRELGVQTHEIISGKYGQAAGAMRNYKDVFWETGEAIMQIADEAERERMAQTLLGRSWDELIPLFKAGRAAYEDALEAAPTNSEDAIQNAAELNDKIAELEQSFRVLKTEVLGEIAPALTKAATILENLVNSITEYLKTDEGQAALKNIENVISSIVDDIANIDPEDVVN